MTNKKIKLLVIEDEKALLYGLSKLLERNGYEIIKASTGTEALDAVENHAFDLIVSDVMIPPPNGFQIKEILSEDPLTTSIPFIFLTARVDQEDMLLGLSSGADDYITKPFDKEELLARVKAVLRRTQIERERAREEISELAEVEMDRFKQEVLQNIHHEMRTPLVNILMPLEAAVANKFENPEEQVRFTRMALNNANRLHAMVEDLILLTNIDNGNLNTIRQSINFQSDFYTEIEKIKAQYTHKTLNVEIDFPDMGDTFAPRNEFKRACYHLIENAFKFSPEIGNILITATAPGDGSFNMKVLDQGEGIPQELREKVFERYYQIDQGDSRRFEGLGVGLAISRTIAQTLGGDVKMMDRETGCEVAFFIPPGENEFK